MRFVYRALMLLLCLGVLPGAYQMARADYPDRPIRLVLLFPPGGETNPMARSIGEELGKKLNTTIVVDNRPGAAGNIAAALVARAPKDGYTLLWGLGSQLVVNPSLYKGLPYDVEKDFTPISLIAETSLVLAVNPKIPANSVQELIKYMKDNPGKLNAAAAGVGSPLHLANVLFMSRTGTDFVQINYPGNTALPVRTGEADLVFGSVGSLLGFIKENTVRPLAVTGPERLPLLPELPTVMEAGVPGYVMTSWHSLLAPAGTPQPIIDKLHKALLETLATPEVKSFLVSRAVRIVTSTPDELRQRIRDETELWQKLLKDAGVEKLN